MALDIPQQHLPFLTSLCWQISDMESLTPPEILQTYERGWRYLDILAKPSAEEWRLISDLIDEHGSWLSTALGREASFSMKHQWHESILSILQYLQKDSLRDWEIYFGGGTFISLLCQEHRLSQDIDLITNHQGYRQLRRHIQEQGYDALFANQTPLQFPRSIQADQYGVRFPVVIDGTVIKIEIIAEGRIELDAPIYPDWSPIPCLSPIDCWAEKLLANADRWNDDRLRARDLIDLSVLRLMTEIPPMAISKAEAAYPVMPALQAAMDRFQADRDWRYRCYQSLAIDRPSVIVDGIDLLAAYFDRPPTDRLWHEIQAS